MYKEGPKKFIHMVSPQFYLTVLLFDKVALTFKCRLSEKLVSTFADRGCHVVSVTDPYGHILGFLDWSLYLFFQVAPQFYSRGWVDPVPDPLLLRKSGSIGNQTWTSGSVARNSVHQTTEVVHIYIKHYCTHNQTSYVYMKTWTKWLCNPEPTKCFIYKAVTHTQTHKVS
jgi:hypothetical protein